MSVRKAVVDNVRDAVWGEDAVGGAVRRVVWTAVWGVVGTAVWGAVWRAVGGAVEDTVAAAVRANDQPCWRE